MYPKIAYSNNNNNCFIFVILNTIFYDFYKLCSPKMFNNNKELTLIYEISELIHTNKEEYSINKKINELRLLLFNNCNEQGDAVDFLNKICNILFKINKKLYYAYLGLTYKNKKINTNIHILYIVNYNDISNITEYSPLYIILNLSLNETKSIATKILHMNNNYILKYLIYHIGDLNGGHWYYQHIINSKIIQYDNLVKYPTESNIIRMPILIIFEKQKNI